MKIAVASVKYSPNLGDGVIAECLEAELRRTLPRAQLVDCDLAGRRAFGQAPGRARAAALNMLRFLPGPVRNMVMSGFLAAAVKLSLNDHYRARLAGADAVIIGGGQLFGDAALNFPLKIAAAAHAARRGKAKLAVYGVGVGAHWSFAAARLFKRALKGNDVIYVSVRDEVSRRRWETRLGPGLSVPCRLGRDPGLIAHIVYGDSQKKSPISKPDRPVIGLCVTAPSSLSLHADEGVFNRGNMRELYAGAARLLLEKGFNVAFFTNGSFDDQAFLDECRPALMAPGGASPAGKITFAPHPKTPRELVRQISVFDGVIAHRLHANIIAYAYKIPHIGLGWDKKLPAFFHSVGRDAYALSVNESNAETIVARLENALAEGIDEKTHARVVREARDEIAQLARAIQAPANAVSSVLRGDEK